MKNVISFESRDSESGKKPKNFEKLGNERIAAHSKNFNLKQEKIKLSDVITNKTIEMEVEMEYVETPKELERCNRIRDPNHKGEFPEGGFIFELPVYGERPMRESPNQDRLVVISEQELIQTLREYREQIDNSWEDRIKYFYRPKKTVLKDKNDK